MLLEYLEALIRLFYPAACEVCKVSLTLEEKILCGTCAQKVESLAWPLEETLVEERFEYLDHVWTAYAYNSPVKELLHGVKYSSKDYLLKTFRKHAAHLAQAVTSDFGYESILPIPINRLKLVQRHFNQSEILAGLLAPWMTAPVKRSFLIKRHAIPSQTSLSHQERAINVYGAFRLRRPQKAVGHSFLLIDDVLTTGATANEAARLLKLHGAKRVDFLALARTPSPEEKNALRSAAPGRSENSETRHSLPPTKTV